MAWIKFRHKYSSGPDPWLYAEIKEETTDCVADFLGDEYDDSMHYRGIEWEFIDQPPFEVVVEMIYDLAMEMERARRRINELAKLLVRS